MTTRTNESRDIATRSRRRAGATCVIGWTRGGHRVALGRASKLLFTDTPNDWRSLRRIRNNIRIATQELRRR